MNSADSRFQEALAAYDRDDFVPAAAAFERLLLDFPDHVQAHYKLANVRKEQGHPRAAEKHYREVLRLESMHAEALNNLGAVMESGGRTTEAEACYRQAIGGRPGLAQPYTNLGRLLQSQGRDGEAAKWYRRAIAEGLDAELFGHLLDAASGGFSPKAPPGYVHATFDAFAAQFDQHLVGDLDYRVPAQLVALALDAPGSAADQGPLEILDLGCGTGLVGAALATHASLATHSTLSISTKNAPQSLPQAWSLTGVDLSQGMLDVARQRGGYAALHCADIEAWLEQAPRAHFDLVVAADVFIYLGELSAVFTAVARCLKFGGRFAFSVESCEGADWRLLASGRYAQSGDYVERLAARNGFHARRRVPTAIRRGVQGRMFVLGRE